MSVTAQKARTPITSTIVAPINESVIYGPNNTIIFRIGPSDLLYWLIQDSYFIFDVDFSTTSDAIPGPSSGTTTQPLVIRSSGMFIDNVRLLHAGNEVYYQQYNIAQQMLDYVKSGQDYLNSNFNEWLTHETYDKVVANPDDHNNLVLKSTEWTTSDGVKTLNKKGYILRVGQILRCLSQCDNFPLKFLSQQLEIRFQLAKVEDFICGVSQDNKNFYDVRGNQPVGTLADSTAQGAGSWTEPAYDMKGLTYRISNMRLYMFGEDIDPSYEGLIMTENQAGSGKIWRYKMPMINLRNVPAQSHAGYIISNFQCITENTDEMFIWATRDSNLSTMIRLDVMNMQLRFGPYLIPKSPTADDSYVKPALYKALVDDVLEYSTAYYTSSNKDYYNSYPILPASRVMTTVTNSVKTGKAPEHDTFITLAGNFTTDDKKLGSNSKAWNSQYNLQYNLMTQEKSWIWLLAVESEYVLTLRDGILSSTNL